MRGPDKTCNGIKRSALNAPFHPWSKENRGVERENSKRDSSLLDFPPHSTTSWGAWAARTSKRRRSMHTHQQKARLCRNNNGPDAYFCKRGDDRLMSWQTLPVSHKSPTKTLFGSRCLFSQPQRQKVMYTCMCWSKKSMFWCRECRPGP
jgi:hypothetical protein